MVWKLRERRKMLEQEMRNRKLFFGDSFDAATEVVKDELSFINELLGEK
jgi:hypothetical protein